MLLVEVGIGVSELRREGGEKGKEGEREGGKKKEHSAMEILNRWTHPWCRVRESVSRKVLFKLKSEAVKHWLVQKRKEYTFQEEYVPMFLV